MVELEGLRRALLACEPADFNLRTVPRGSPRAAVSVRRIDGVAGSLEPLLERAAKQKRDGQGDIAFHQNNVFRNNTYSGDWSFMPYAMDRRLGWDTWRAAPYN